MMRFVVNMNMRVTFLSIVLALLLGSGPPAFTAQASLSSKTGETSWKTSIMGTLHSKWSPSLAVAWETDIEADFEDTLHPVVSVNPQCGFASTLPFGNLLLGDFASDQRFAGVFSTNINMPFSTIKKLGPPRVSPVSFSEALFRHWVCSVPLSEEEVWIHVYGLQTGVGLLAEQRTFSGIIRFSSLWLSSPSTKIAKPIIDYRALPVRNGCVNYLWWTSCPVSPMNHLSLEIQVLLRWAYDTAFGLGLSTGVSLRCVFYDVISTYTRRHIPLWPGSIIDLSYTTEDAPLSREAASVTYKNSLFAISASYTDTWWRITNYAGDYQRRHIQAKGECSFLFSHDISVGIKGTFQWRWNRNGSRGTTHMASIIIDGEIQKVVVSIEPCVRWGGSTHYGVTICTEYFWNSHDTLRLELSLEGSSSDLSCTFTRYLKSSGAIRFSLMHDGAIKLSYSTVLGE